MADASRSQVQTEEEETEDEKTSLDPKQETRRGSVDVKKLNWAQKLLNRNNRLPKEPKSAYQFEGSNNKPRSLSVDLGRKMGSPFTGRRMLHQEQEIIEGVQSVYTSDVDREVQSITSRKPLAPPPGTVEYMVSGNETLASIAAKHKSTTSELMKINRMMSSLVFPGQKLFVPTEDYVPLSYGSQNASPRTSPKLRSGSVDQYELLRPKQKGLDSEDLKQQKKNKNRLKDRRLSDGLMKRRKSSTQKDGVIFSARVEYVTGSEGPHMPGLLEITSNEVKFEPDLTENDKELMNDLVRYRLSLGKAMVAANIIEDNPYRVAEEKRKGSRNPSVTENSAEASKEDKSQEESKAAEKSQRMKSKAEMSEEKGSDSSWSAFESHQNVITFQATAGADGNTETKEEKGTPVEEATVDGNFGDKSTSNDAAPLSAFPSTPSSVKYLLVKLGIPSQAVKERPTISSLIRVCLPIHETTTVEHCFAIPQELVESLIEFLQSNYSDAYGKTDTDSSERFDAINDLMKQQRASGARTFRRTLSVAELCNLPLPDMSTQSSILTEKHIRILREHLLSSAEGRPWNLVYSSSLHGYSIGTLYRSMLKTDLTTMLIVRDMEDKIFGAMLPCSIRQSDSFYGNGETFLFTFHPLFKKYCWSGKNSYFVKGNIDNFYIGASDGVFGLWMHDNLDHGRTQRCETFDNDLLTETSEDFHIRCVEVWQFPFSLEE